MQGKALQYATWRRTCTNPKGRVFISGVYSSRRPGQDRQPRRVHRILPDSGLVRGPQSWQPGSSAHGPSTRGWARHSPSLSFVLQEACDHKRCLPRPVCAEVKRAESPLSPPSLSCPRSRSTACTQPSAQANGFRLAPPEGEARFQAASPVGYGLRHVCDLHTICAALCSHVCRKR